MPDKEVAVYTFKNYMCGSCQYLMTINWDNKTVACINADCDMRGIDLILKPTILKVRNNAKGSDNPKTVNR